MILVILTGTENNNFLSFMLRRCLIYGAILITLSLFSSCIEPYIPQIGGYSSLLVVEGLVTDANSSYTVTLSRTERDPLGISPKVTDAVVSIYDDKGNTYSLKNAGNGSYKTDSTEFRGAVGNTYILHIILDDGAVYESQPCTMLPVADIDSVYFGIDKQFANNGTVDQQGISIYLDSRNGINNKYYRWTYEETWKFKIPYPKSLNYINDTTILTIPIKDVYCWKNNKSDEILIHSTDPGASAEVNKMPIVFISSDLTDRLMLEYSILIKQYSVSEDEFRFWDNLKKVNQTGSDIFASVPYSVTSNVHNQTNYEERVLGYFQVSSMTQKRKYIYFDDIARSGLPHYQNKCQLFLPDPAQYKMSWNQIYSLFCADSLYTFVEPIYYPGNIDIYRLVFTTPDCSNCKLTGSIKRPDFWQEQK